ncbi:MAG: NusG domain II-containing protein [Lachnospiraceae bacterium]|nr:NusG domain II-containing protein [Lachnospiraceae bacterium]
MKKKDFILIAVILALALAGLFFIRTRKHEEGRYAVVYIDGEEFGKYDLEVPQEIVIETDRGYNKIVIENGAVRMEEADCPDLICVHHKSISYDKESIICLPHRLVVEVTGGEESGIDAVTY